MNNDEQQSQCRCCEKIAAVQDVVWQQIQTISLLMERIEKMGDRLQELYLAAEQDRQQAQAAIWKNYLREKIEEGNKKNGKH
jgi:hypothetical protein